MPEGEGMMAEFVPMSKVLKGKPIKLKVKHKRTRKGCDFCTYNKTYNLHDPPTQLFIGYCGDIIWCCQDCMNKIKQRKLKRNTG